MRLEGSDLMHFTGRHSLSSKCFTAEPAGLTSFAADWCGLVCMSTSSLLVLWFSPMQATQKHAAGVDIQCPAYVALSH